MLERTITRFIKTGRLTVIQPDNSVVLAGQPESNRCLNVVVRLRKWITPIKLSLWPDLYLGEAYVEGSLVLEQGSIWDLLSLCALNQPWQDQAEPAQPRALIGGHLISALVGLLVVKLCGPASWAAALPVGLAMVAMHVTVRFSCIAWSLEACGQVKACFGNTA